MPDLAGLKSALKKALGLTAASTEAVGTTDTQTLTNKTLGYTTVERDANEILDIYRPSTGEAHLSFHHNNSAAAKTRTTIITSVLTDNTAGSEDTALNFWVFNNGAFFKAVEIRAGIMLFNSSLNSFRSGGFMINDPAMSFNYIFATSNLAGTRTVTLPLLTGNDTFAFEAHTQTLTNKALGSGTTLGADLDCENRNIVDINGLAMRSNDGSTSVSIFTKANTSPVLDIHFFADYTKQVGATSSSLYFGYNADWSGISFYSKWSGSNKLYFSIDATVDTVGIRSGNVDLGTNGRIRLQDTGLTAQRIFTYPDTAGENTINTATQTLTNKTIAAGSNTISGITDGNIASHTSTKVTITAKGQLNSTIVYNDQANTYGDLDQIFRSTRVKLRNPANTFSYLFTASAIVADRTWTLPLLTGNDTAVAEAHTQTLTNKTVNATNNTITDTSIATGDLMASSGSKFVRRAKGTGLQVLRTNTGATDIEWATLDNERVGKHQANGNASTTVFNIAHGLGSNPTYAFATCSSITNTFTYTTDATNIIITFSTAPASGTNNVVVYWRVMS